jgi:hypothetical protein
MVGHGVTSRGTAVSGAVTVLKIGGVVNNASFFNKKSFVIMSF